MTILTCLIILYYFLYLCVFLYGNAQLLLQGIKILYYVDLQIVK